ncbi:hypothetical protein PG984_009609 [Apiospora sp. TS-2023a]
MDSEDESEVGSGTVDTVDVCSDVPELVGVVFTDPVDSVAEGSALVLGSVSLKDSTLLVSTDADEGALDELASTAEDVDSWVVSEAESVLDGDTAAVVEV